MNEIVGLLEKGESITVMRMLKDKYGYDLIKAKRLVENIIERKYGGISGWRDSLRKKRIEASKKLKNQGIMP